MRACLVLVAAVAGCRARTPTYHRDVAPIIAAHCAECHREGGVAAIPPLDSYANLKQYAQPVRFAVQTRRMPPWGADNTGLCGTWQDARWLSTDEIATIAAWQQAGAPEGEPVPPRMQPHRPQQFRRDASVETPLYKPGIGPGGNRCFVTDPGLDRDRLLSAIRVVPSDPRGVAQITLYSVDSANGEADLATLGRDYPCFGTARARDARVVASWTWPRPLLRLPAAVRLHAQRKLVVQIHYDVALAGGVFQASTIVQLEFDDAAREAQVLPVSAAGSLAPGQPFVSVENSLPIARRLRVAGIAPRMHIRGRTMHLTVERAGSATCLADFDHWHFNDEQLYRAQTPAVLEPGDRVRVSCAYNTLGRDRPVVFGDAIDDEECVAYLFVTD